MLEDVKTLLEIKDNASDAVLKLMLRDAASAVLNYCNIKKLPPALEPVVRQIVIEVFKNENGDNAASIKRGDTQITYNGFIGLESFTEKQKSSMNAFRRLKVR